MPGTQLSAHFWLAEMTASQTAARQGLSNIPTPDIVEILRDTCARMEVVRARLGGLTIHVSSGYRAPAVNAAVGGARTSAHLTGHAVDFECFGYGTPLEVCRAIASDPSIAFDQLIEEGTWTHISFDPRMRREVLTKGPNGTYVAGLR